MQMKLSAYVLAWISLCSITWAGPSVLVLTTSEGHEHDVVKRTDGNLSLVEQSLTDRLRGKIDVVATKDASAINAQNLAKFSAVIFYTTGELKIADAGKQALLDFIKAGGGFVGIHSATDTLYQWPEYGQLIGARFNGHPWTQQVKLNVLDPNHPATKSLGNSFAINDEIYQFREFVSEGTKVLLTLDKSSVDISKGANPAGEFPIAWTRESGKGKIFYTALGHRSELWSDEQFLSHVQGGIESVLKKDVAVVPLPPAVWSGVIVLALVVIANRFSRKES